MLHLHSIISPLSKAQSSPLTNTAYSSRLGICEVDSYKPWVLQKKSRSKNCSAMEEDSEFEVDMEKARDALRKLDEQFKTISEKQTTPPKIRAADFSEVNFRDTEASRVLLSGSFLPYLASMLLVFSIVYNVVFIMVIKPSIDGNDREEPVYAAKVDQGTQQGESVKQLIATPEMPMGM